MLLSHDHVRQIKKCEFSWKYDQVSMKFTRYYEESREGGWGPNPISQEIAFFKSQLKPHNPSLCCSNWNPIPIFLLFVFMNPSPSAQNPISQRLKKANASSHFTPLRPSMGKMYVTIIL